MARITNLLGATAFFSLYLMALGCEPATNGQASEDSLDFVEAELVMIDGDSTAALDADEILTVDLTMEEMVYAIDLTDETLQADRILIIEDTDEEFLLSELLDTEIPEQGYSKEEVERLVLTSEAENFGTLDPAELEELATIGTVVQETEVFVPASDYAVKSGALFKISIEIYWESKKGKERCIKIGVGTKSAEDGNGKPQRPEALKKGKADAKVKTDAKVEAKEEAEEKEAADEKELAAEKKEAADEKEAANEKEEKEDADARFRK